MKFSRAAMEILVGALAVIVFVAFVTFAFTVNQQKVSGYPLHATFNRVDGLSVYADVRLAGIRIGEVTEETFLPDSGQARLTMAIEPGVAIPTDSAAMVASEGLFGGKFVKIDLGGDSETLKPGASFSYVQDSVDFEHLLKKIVEAAEAQRAKTAKSAGSGAGKSD
jgi:phospholipid/cholesterol/gamma-HCH transport system substrate-binding protein